jgi:hypothetical protein
MDGTLLEAKNGRHALTQTQLMSDGEDPRAPMALGKSR